MARTGRPNGITPEIQKTICDAITAGGFLETAVQLAGVPKSTFYDWLKRGAKAKSGVYKEFSDAVKKALAVAETRYVAIIATAAKTQWTAAAWMLERRFPKKWAKRSETNSPASTGTPSTQS